MVMVVRCLGAHDLLWLWVMRCVVCCLSPRVVVISGIVVLVGVGVRLIGTRSSASNAVSVLVSNVELAGYAFYRIYILLHDGVSYS
jgi:hypothetical protein